MGFTALGRAFIGTAAFGLIMIGGTGVAVARSNPVGISPKVKVVARAPTAVSVTFDKPLRAGGATMRVLSSSGDVGRGPVTTAAKILRRSLRPDAPGGGYRVEWAAISSDGHRVSGSFSFTAARGNGVTPTAGPTPTDFTTTQSAVTTQATSIQTATTQAGSTAAGSAVSARPPAPPKGPLPPNGPAAAPGPAPVAGRAMPGQVSSGSSSSGFTIVPLAAAGLLVLAAGAISLLNRPRTSG